MSVPGEALHLRDEPRPDVAITSRINARGRPHVEMSRHALRPAGSGPPGQRISPNTRRLVELSADRAMSALGMPDRSLPFDDGN